MHTGATQPEARGRFALHRSVRQRSTDTATLSSARPVSNRRRVTDYCGPITAVARQARIRGAARNSTALIA